MGIFSGVRVVELASVLAGPGVGQFFAELGAEVLKIENPATDGDVTRSWKLKGEQTGDVSAYFSSINWGKRSISLNIAKSDGLEVLHRLLKDCDMVIASYKPGDAEKLGVDYQSLVKINEALIYGRITGYGDDNDQVGYDAIIQAEAGFMSMNGTPDSGPTKMPVALMDVLAGHHLKEGMLLAYISRLKTGKGGEVSVSLIEAAVASLANQGANWLVAGKIPQRQGSSHPNIAPYGNIFQTRDQRSIILAVGTDRQFKNLCDALGFTELADDPDYKNNYARVGNRNKLYHLLQERITHYNMDAILQQLHFRKVPVGAVHNVSEAVEMKEVRGLQMEQGQLKGIRTFSARFSGAYDHSSHLLPPPGYGAHTAQVLSEELGMSASEINLLKEKRVI